MGEEQLKELGKRLTGLKVTFDTEIATTFRVELSDEGLFLQYINMNLKELNLYHHDILKRRGFSAIYLTLQALLHEIAHYKQFLKYGKQDFYSWTDWYTLNRKKAQRVADRYALMYYRRFVGNAIYT